MIAAVLATPAWAHGGGSVHFEWTWDPAVTAPLAVSLALFAVGWVRLFKRSTHGASLLRRRALLFGAGWVLLVTAVVSPLHQAGEHSFAAHMAEHELMMLAAAPLFVMSEPLSIMLWALPAQGRRAVGRFSHQGWLRLVWRRLTAPVTATLMQAAALWLWHAPALFDRALASDDWHMAQHLSFLITALLFWTAVLPSRSGNPGVAALCLFATSIVSGALGAMMALSQSPWYAGYALLGMTPMGLSPIEDQQLAGLLMWVPGGMVHAAAALVVIGSALKAGSSREAAGARPS
jgi:cytochrome c oxidase assembly factor CtaG